MTSPPRTADAGSRDYQHSDVAHTASSKFLERLIVGAHEVDEGLSEYRETERKGEKGGEGAFQSMALRGVLCSLNSCEPMQPGEHGLALLDPGVREKDSETLRSTDLKKQSSHNRAGRRAAPVSSARHTHNPKSCYAQNQRETVETL
ncbi:hypothetical protein EYF80_017356 [Liparis tanakae]|uniref:Uncharacterized protein n=1 Tax=Liparis tanakae TaxID=230148 RepID=A0A4Z2I3N6_9TELE|nr:hypothetical protein EYF80_017356 [Liparis tanakae]